MSWEQVFVRLFNINVNLKTAYVVISFNASAKNCFQILFFSWNSLKIQFFRLLSHRSNRDTSCFKLSINKKYLDYVFRVYTILYRTYKSSTYRFYIRSCMNSKKGIIIFHMAKLLRMSLYERRFFVLNFVCFFFAIIIFLAVFVVSFWKKYQIIDYVTF